MPHRDNKVIYWGWATFMKLCLGYYFKIFQKFFQKLLQVNYTSMQAVSGVTERIPSHSLAYLSVVPRGKSTDSSSAKTFP